MCKSSNFPRGMLRVWTQARAGADQGVGWAAGCSVSESTSHSGRLTQLLCLSLQSGLKLAHGWPCCSRVLLNRLPILIWLAFDRMMYASYRYWTRLKQV